MSRGPFPGGPRGKSPGSRGSSRVGGDGGKGRKPPRSRDDVAHAAVAAPSRADGREGSRRGTDRAALDPELHVLGRHAVEAVLRHQADRAKKLWLLSGSAAASALEPLARSLGIPIAIVEVDVLDGLAGRGAAHQGAVLQCGPFPYADIEDLDHAPDLTLVLDGVEDPRNLGAAVRAAWALGADLVVVPRDRAAACTASAHKAAVGALSRIPVARVGNLKRALDMLKDKGAWVVGAEADADTPPWRVDLKGKVVLVVGGEDRGVRRLTRDACDHVVSIPMVNAEMSLNAADAATVLLYEALRQRKG